ncbi:MAG: transketolase C-terminal domain-containing protein, partial [Dehalococcoidia bacterium]|nr:transketolase C-terminal domain-containing protein [Dehalococcoidia bacterium]
LRYVTGGQVSLPIVYFLRFGAKGSMGAQHSHSIHSMLMNVPGLKIVMPNTPADAKGMMKTAIRDDNPVMFFVHGGLHKTAGEVPDGDHTVPFGVARIVREGSDVTVVAAGTMLRKVQKVADEYAQYGIGLEIIDPRSLVPLDKESILKSVAKTGRLVVVDESHQTCGLASEICTLVAEEAFASLKAPPRRVCPLDVPIPYSPPLEDYVLPDEKRISKAIEDILE